MSLIISKECEASSDPAWRKRSEGIFIARMELPYKGDRIVIAMANNPKFFQSLAEYGHVFIVEPVEDTWGTVDGTDGMSDEFMRRACTDENRYALMTQAGEGPTLEFINSGDGFAAEMTFEYTGEHSQVEPTK
jgi:hypothetical protein